MSSYPSHSSVTRTTDVEPGDSADSLPTPALLIDVDILERNLKRMRDSLPSHVRLRPHSKAHKCSALALKQLNEGGAIGVCCQKLCEVEGMIAGGVTDILVSNEIVDARRLNRLAELAKRPEVALSMCVDNTTTVNLLAEACANHGSSIECLIEVNVGQNRCGVEPDSRELIDVAQTIQSHAPALRFGGIQCYHGWAQHARTAEERRSLISTVADLARLAVARLKNEAGLDCARVTGGGSGTYLNECASGVFNEVQPGSYALWDADYGANEEAPFEQALFVVSRVMSVSKSARRFVLDCGLKGCSHDSGVPQIAPHSLCYSPHWKCASGGDEHLVVTAEQESSVDFPSVNQCLTLIPSHVDPTCNMHDFLFVVRGSTVVHVWPVDARSPGW